MGAMGAAVLRYFSETGARLTALGDPKYGAPGLLISLSPLLCIKRW